MKNLKSLYVALALAVVSFVSTEAFSQPYPSPTFQNLTVLGTCTGCGGGGGGSGVTSITFSSPLTGGTITGTGTVGIPAASNSALGAAQCDGTTITCSSGILTAVTGGGGNVLSPGSGFIVNHLIKTSNTSGTGILDAAAFSATPAANTITETGGSGTLASGFIPAINLATGGAGGVTGNLPVANLNSGASASSSTFWRGDGIWAAPAGGSGTVGSGATNQIAAYPGNGTSVQGYTVANNCSAAISGSNINFTCSGGSSGLSGMISGQLGVAGSSATITSSQAFSATPAANTIPETGGGNTLAAGFVPAINLATGGAGGVAGNLPVSNLNSGTSASSSTFWRGDGIWATPSGGGNTTSTSLSNNVIPKANGANSITNSSVTDNGTTVNTTEAFSQSGVKVPVWVPIPLGWVAGQNPDGGTLISVIPINMTISAIKGRVETAEGSAGRVDVYATSGGTACASGTDLTNTTGLNINAQGDQTLSGSTTSLIAGQSLCLHTISGTFTTNKATITVYASPT